MTIKLKAKIERKLKNDIKKGTDYLKGELDKYVDEDELTEFIHEDVL